MSDQPKSRTARFGLMAVMNEPDDQADGEARSRPQMSPSFAPTSMNAAMTSV